MKGRTSAVAAVALGAAVLCAAGLAGSSKFSDWSPATRVEDEAGTDPSFNGPDLDGCPFISRDGKSFYMASNRAGGLGGIDIWVATRSSEDDPWGAPVNVGAAVNSSANDFCPTLARDGRHFYFVSNRAGGCGGADMYGTRLNRGGGFEPVVNLGCQVNSAADEASPMPFPVKNGQVMYFSSNRPGGFAPDPPDASSGDSDLYASRWDGDVFGPPGLVPGANTEFDDGQPNVRRDRLELFFFSNRPGTLGLADIYAATRKKTSDPWSTPFNLGPNVNSDAADTRPSLSWDAETLYFGSTRAGGEGSSDHYMTTRERLEMGR
jgi:Tol biopolymer transport system component